MLRFHSRNKGITAHALRKAVALFQVLVLLTLALPVCALEPLPGQEPAAISQAGEIPQDGHESCPCCPDQDQPESGGDTCSSCSFCTCHIPLTPGIHAGYSPSESLLTTFERFTTLPEIHIPIVVPPQNIS